MSLRLFIRLKDKGILGELQTFIQQKMVEKLSIKGFISKSDTKPFELNEEMLRLLVFDYLHHRKLFYTMSVLKIESLGSDCSSQSALKMIKRRLVQDLEVNDPLRNLLLSASENTTLMESLLDKCRKENSWKEDDVKGPLTGKFPSPKLGINVQTQTGVILDTEHSELERNMNLPMKQNHTFSNDLMPLRLQNEAYSIALQNQTETSILADVSEHTSSSRGMHPKILVKSKATCIEEYKEGITNGGSAIDGAPLHVHAKRIEKAQHYLNVLDSRLSDISRRYERALHFQIL